MVHRSGATLPLILLLVAGTVAVPADAFACRFDLTGSKADRVFFTLGMLFEYGGRISVSATQVDVIYCDQREQLPLFRRVLASLAKEQGLPGDLREETKQDCLTLLHSPSLAPRLGACYPHQAGPLPLALFARPGTSVAAGAASMSPKDLDRRRALAYVAGVWARYRRDRSILLTAGKSKADLVASLLTALGCASVRVETSVGYIPGASTVHFEPTAEVSEWLRKTW